MYKKQKTIGLVAIFTLVLVVLVFGGQIEDALGNVLRNLHGEH